MCKRLLNSKTIRNDEVEFLGEERNTMTFKVRNYKVRFENKKWTCNCPDNTYRGHKIGHCKHIYKTQAIILSGDF